MVRHGEVGFGSSVPRSDIFEDRAKENMRGLGCTPKQVLCGRFEESCGRLGYIS
ncbi:unnamed protein product [Meloidogyne enterolobii]|uniref:Uncharacterized protein n=1 Tax=Meloidogyne enterolobii TaxID=390850 RepID=A0ACB0XMR1_MELEN